jgi:hypothetical protein
MTRPLVLLLTATIDPGRMVLVKRRDPELRLKDYRSALKKWSRVQGFDSVIFCENSGADLTSLRKWAENLTKDRTRIRFISFQGNDHSPELGKGYGEIRILKHAISATGLAPHTLLMKVTGRYFVRNASDLIRQIRIQPEYAVFCRADPDRGLSSSEVFAANVAFLETFLFPLHQRIDDSAGVYLEHVLADAIRTGAASGVMWTRWARPIRLQGVSGTFNRPLSGPRRALGHAAMWLLEHTYSIRRRVGLYRAAK